MAKANWGIVAAIGVVTVGAIPVINHVRQKADQLAAMQRAQEAAIMHVYQAYLELRQETRSAAANQAPHSYQVVDPSPQTKALGLDQYASHQAYVIKEMLKPLPGDFVLSGTEYNFTPWDGQNLTKVRADVEAAVKKANTQFVQGIYDAAVAKMDVPTDSDQLDVLIKHTARALQLIEANDVHTTDINGQDVAQQIQTYNESLHFSMAKIILAEIPTMIEPASLHHVTLPLKAELKAAGGLGLSALFPGESLTDDAAYARIREMADKREKDIQPKITPASAVIQSGLEKELTR